MNYVIVLLFVCSVLRGTWGAACTGNTDTGINGVAGNADNGQTDTYYISCDPSFQFTCCGIINRWQYMPRISGQALQLIVWRPTGVGQNYQIAFTYTHTASSTSSQTFTPIGNYLAKEGDCLGWHSSGSEVVAYKTGGQAVTAQYLASGSVNVGGDTDFSGANSAGPFEWGINARSNAPSDPTFPTQTTAYTTPETTAVSTSVASVTFSDADIADELTITLTSASVSGYFVLVDNGDKTGTINSHSTNSLADINGQTVTLNFQATDLCGASVTGSITVEVINDPPQLLNLVASTDVGEDMLVQTTITTFTCTDASGSVTVDSTENPSNAPNPDFFFTKYVSGDEYALMARAQTNPSLGQFDYNVQRYYDITISCSDGVDTVTDTIRANLVPNSPPVINNLPAGTSVDVSQTSGIGTVVFTVDFTDADGDTVAFSMTSDPATSPFEILDSGEVIVKESIETYTDAGFDLFITPADGKNAGIQRTLSVVITDINNAPTFTNLNNNVVVDENTANPTTIFTTSYSDVDTTDTHTFFMTNADGGTAYFEISTAGVISTKATINYEAMATTIFPFTIVISDGRASATGTLTVTVADVNEALTWNSATYRIDVAEQAAVGTTLTDPGFAVTDPDIGDSYTCSMNCGASDGYFGMNSACRITVSSVYSLDSGLSNTVTCTVKAVDEGSFTATTTLIITVLDADNYTPVFSSGTYPFTVSSQASADTSIGTVTATDSDAGTYGQFSYSLDQTGLSGNYFKIDSTGLISTQVYMPDVCNCSDVTYQVPVLATDTGGLVGTATVYITVTAVTTTTAATTTDRYKTFFEDTKNIVWFSLLMATLAVATVVTVFVCVKFICTGPSLCKNPFGRRYHWRPYHREMLREPPPRIEPPPPPPPPKPKPLESVRRPPPPKAFQFWRSDPQFK